MLHGECQLYFQISGGHFWYSLSSKAKFVDDDKIKLLKYGSWATSSGCADWYCIQTISPDFNRDYSNMSCFLIYKVNHNMQFLITIIVMIGYL